MSILFRTSSDLVSFSGTITRWPNNGVKVDCFVLWAYIPSKASTGICLLVMDGVPYPVIRESNSTKISHQKTYGSWNETSAVISFALIVFPVCCPACSSFPLFGIRFFCRAEIRRAIGIASYYHQWNGMFKHLYILPTFLYM